MGQPVRSRGCWRAKASVSAARGLCRAGAPRGSCPPVRGGHDPRNVRCAGACASGLVSRRPRVAVLVACGGVEVTDVPAGAVGAVVGGEVVAGVGDAAGAAGLFAGAVAAFVTGVAVEPVGRDGHGIHCS